MNRYLIKLQNRTIYFDENTETIIKECMKDKGILFNTAVRYLIKRSAYLEEELFYANKELDAKKKVYEELIAKGTRLV